IEAEDKLLGPLSLKQFIFAIITVALLFINFRIIISPLGIARWPIIAVLLLPTLIFGILAAPIGKDQPTEIWLLARIRFFLKPRRRIWDQEGPKHLVTVTAPKRIEKHLYKNFTQNEVTSRLDALANVMDSRGWAVKNVNVNLNNQLTYDVPMDDDRLVSASSIAQEVSNVDVHASDDILDARNNSTAMAFESMIQVSETKHRQELQNQIASARTFKQNPAPTKPQLNPADEWFNKQQMNPAEPPLAENLVSGGSGQSFAPGTANAALPVQPVALPQSMPAPSSADEQALLNKVHQQQEQTSRASGFGHLKTLQPIGQAPTVNPDDSAQTAPAQTASPTLPNPDIINLSRDNDKTVETLARQANKPKQTKLDNGEVVISLH
ncbi:MAG: PrgI family protein, partial [bacterium]|nr:PrgI family protein [bacterium]